MNLTRFILFLTIGVSCIFGSACSDDDDQNNSNMMPTQGGGLPSDGDMSLPLNPSVNEDMNLGGMSPNQVMGGETAGGQMMGGETMGGETMGGESAGGTMQGGAMVDDLTLLWDGGITPGPAEQSWVLSHGSLPCEVGSVVSPAIPDEANHFAAARFTLPFSPFMITHIEYALASSEMTPSCTAALAHEVHLYVIDANEPIPASPSSEAILAEVIQVASDESKPFGRGVNLTLSQPITLEEGQSLVVSVQMKLEGEDHLCIGYCIDRRAPVGSQFWSSAANEPYSWADLSTFNLNEAYIIMIEGVPL